MCDLDYSRSGLGQDWLIWQWEMCDVGVVKGYNPLYLHWRQWLHHSARSVTTHVSLSRGSWKKRSRSFEDFPWCRSPVKNQKIVVIFVTTATDIVWRIITVLWYAQSSPKSMDMVMRKRLNNTVNVPKCCQNADCCAGQIMTKYFHFAQILVVYWGFGEISALII